MMQTGDGRIVRRSFFANESIIFWAILDIFSPPEKHDLQIFGATHYKLM